MRILLLSAYDARSHQFWHQGLRAAFPDCDWFFHSMKPRYFSWRIRGNPLHWVYDAVDLTQPYDLLVATSMVDLATLKGLDRRLARLPSLLYFHENQLFYPLSSNASSSVEPAMVNIYSALAADSVCFNSAYNLESFSSGFDSLLKRFPDHVPGGLKERILKKASVLPVPLPDDVFRHCVGRVASNERLNIVWNHRWEYDKGPERLLQLVKSLPSHVACRVHVIGQSFRRVPDCMHEVKEVLEQQKRLGHWGEIEDRDDYLGLLAQSDIVLSTALHDFFGVAVVEGMALGCCPVVPDRLAYRETVPSKFRYYSALSMDASELKREMNSAIDLIRYIREHRPPAPRVTKMSWHELSPRYKATFEECVGAFS